MRSEFDFEDEDIPIQALDQEEFSGEFAELDLGKELTEQLARSKRILELVENDPMEKGSSKAALLNAISQIIAKMVSMRVAVWNGERLKEQERTLIECLKETDPALTDRFLRLYEQRLEHLKTFRAG